MRLAAQDDALLRRPDGLLVDGPRSVPVRAGPEAGLVGERIHQPRLSPRLTPHRLDGGGGERLPRLRRVLPPEAPRHRPARSPPDASDFRLDVERAAPGDHRVRRRGMDPVVAHVAHAAQHHALRKAVRTLVVPRPQLPQHRQQRVADQHVDLVDQQHERRRIGLRPARQRLQQHLVRAVLRQQLAIDTLQEPVARRQPRPRRQPAQHRAHRLSDVFAGRLRHLDVDVHAPAALGVQPFPQRQQGRRLPRLAGRVQHEVAFVADEPKQLVHIETGQRRNAVVVRRHHRSGRVEEAHAAA